MDPAMMTPCEAMWVAGIIEGEGCIVWNNHCAAIVVTMTDYDVIERLHEWTGVGLVRANKRLTVNRKQVWRWTVARAEDFLSLADEIEPYLLARRAARLREVRAALLQWKIDLADRKASRRAASFRPGMGVCPQGHDKAIVGARPDGYCMECERNRNRTNRVRAA